MTERKKKIKQEPYKMYYKRFKNIEDILTPVNTYKHKKIEYLNVASSFDTETSSFYQNKIKRACMYLWGFGINGKVYVGRTYEELKRVLFKVVEYYGLSLSKRLVVYVHNLAYDFQFIRKWFKWHKIFAIEERKPVYAITEEGIEFRCSYILSGLNLETIGKNLHTYKVEKLVGNLDYSLIRHPKSYISEEEMNYMVNDCLVVMSYIAEYILTLGNITKILITKTSFVRQLCRKNCFFGGDSSHRKSVYKYRAYKEFISNLVITSPQEYNQMTRAFQGGFTHASCEGVGMTFEDVASYDFTSSY